MRILITGSTDGIGLATATRLAERGHAVVIHGRNAERVATAVSSVQTGSDRAVRRTATPDSIRGDFSSLKAVDTMALEIRQRFPDLAVLINNAGVMRRERANSADGYELNLAVNHLAPMLLTLRLLPTLRSNASGPDTPARIVNVASTVHEYNAINWDDLHFERSYDGQAAYGQSKVANVMFTRALAARLHAGDADEFGAIARPPVTVNALHPGVINTKLLHVYYSGGSSPESGTRTSVFLANDPSVSTTTGRYFSDEREKESWVLSAPPHESERLWEVSVEMIESVVGNPLPADPSNVF